MIIIKKYFLLTKIKLNYLLTTKTYNIYFDMGSKPNNIKNNIYLHVDNNIMYILNNISTIKTNNLYYNLNILNPHTNLRTHKYDKFISILNSSVKIIVFNIKWLLLAGILSLLYFYISLFYIQIDFTKQLSVWYILLISYYLLISTFNNFLNKYKYGKFTSAIQRFWKRTGMIFWLIEGFLFLLFFYYFLNSSQEPLYMFDYSNLNQENLIQLKLCYKNMILLSICIYLSFILLLNINFFVYAQSLLILLLISLIIFYTLYIESYQFVYIVSIFGDKEWIFNDINQLWVLEVEQNNLRVKQQYFVLCLVAKYWHFIFIFISWFFFLVKSLESNKISITLLGYNVQNLVILYLLNILCLVQWMKYIFKKFLEITYFWFYTQYDEKLFLTFIIEFWNSILSFTNFNCILLESYNFASLSAKLYYTNELNLWLYF